MHSGDVVVALRGIRKDYRGLRPLRIEHFELRQSESVALLGLDRAAAEVLVNMVTAATLPDAGDVDIFGAATRDITDPDSWLRALDRFGILSDRVVLLDEYTAEQNLALPLSLEVDDLKPDVRARVRQLADEVGIAAETMVQSMRTLGPGALLRMRLAKALALNPRVLLAEHPTAALTREETASFAADLSRIASGRDLATLLITADETFAHAVANRVLTLRPATGELKPAGWRRWFP